MLTGDGEVDADGVCKYIDICNPTDEPTPEPTAAPVEPETPYPVMTVVTPSPIEPAVTPSPVEPEKNGVCEHAAWKRRKPLRAE
jgi:hypothetical protein